MNNSYICNLDAISKAKDILASVRLLALRMREQSYVTIKEALDDLSLTDLQILTEEFLYAPTENSVMYSLLLTTSEGNICLHDDLDKLIGIVKNFLLIELLTRKGFAVSDFSKTTILEPESFQYTLSPQGIISMNAIKSAQQDYLNTIKKDS